MGCDLNKVRQNVNSIIDETIKGNANSITKIGDRFVITYSKQFQVKTRDQAYNMAQSKINALNSKLTKLGYSSKFGPYVTLDNSFSDRIVIHKNSLDKLISAYELRNKAEQERLDLAELVQEVYSTRDTQYAQERANTEKLNSLEDVVYDVDTSNMTRNEYSDFINSRKNLLDYLKNRRKSERDLTNKNILTQRIKRLQDQINILENRDTQSFEVLIKMAKSDIEVVKKTLSGSPSNEVLYYAMPLIRNYSAFITTKFENVIDVMDETDRREFNDVMSDLTLLANKDKNLLLQNADNKTKSIVGQDVIDAGGTAIAVKDVNNYGIFSPSRQLSSVSDIKNSIVQSLYKLINTAKSKLNLLVTKFKTDHNKVVNSLIKFQKNAGLKKDNFYDYMITFNSEGKHTKKYVSKYGLEYDNLKKNATTDRERFEFYVNNHNFKFNKFAWESRKIELENEFNINVAQDIELTAKEVDNGVTIESKLEKELAKFIQKNSAEEMFNIFQLAKSKGVTNQQVNFFTRYSKQGRMRLTKVGEELVYPVEFEPNSKFIDSKWTAIQAMSDTDPRKVFYNFFESNILSSHKRMNTVDHWTDASYIPEKAKKGNVINEAYNSMVKSISQNISTRTQIKDVVTDEYTKDLPRYSQKDRYTIDEMSFDLGDVLFDYYAESIRFKEMYTIQDDVDFLLAALKKVPTFETNRKNEVALDDSGNPIIKEGESNIYRMTKYYVDAQLYNESQQIEGVTGIKVADANLKKRIKELKDGIAKLDLSKEDRDIGIPFIMNDSEYTGTNPKIAQLVKLGTELKSTEPLMRTVTGTKFGNTLIGLTGLKLIGFNPFGGISEILQGMYSLNLISAANTIIKKNTVYSALGEVIKSMNPGSNSKITNLGKYFGTVHNHILGVDLQKNKFTELAYVPYKASSYLVNNTYLVAILKSKKITDKSGKEHVLYDVINVDKEGNFTLTGDFDQIYSDVDGSPSQPLLDLIQEYRDIITENRDRNREYDPIELDAKFLGRAIGQFKSNWMIKAFMKRYQDYRELPNGNEVKGFYRSLGAVFQAGTKLDALGQEVKDYSLSGILKSAGGSFAELLKFSMLGKVLGFKPSEELSELDIANLKMFVREASWALSLLIIITIGTAMASGDDDDDNLPFYKYVINQSSRLLRDITTYSSPSSLMSITKNPMPFVSSVKDMFDLGYKVFKSPLLLSPDYSDADDLHLLRSIEQNTPAIRQIRATYNKIDKITNYRD